MLDEICQDMRLDWSDSEKKPSLTTMSKAVDSTPTLLEVKRA
jgi:hypothetical protein